ncbi:hypothetical protein B1B_07555, partial [mine drainage metagenome]
TDPPYYDAVPYSALSDFFLVWLERVIPRNLRDWRTGPDGLAPKSEEIIDSLELLRGARKEGAKAAELLVKDRSDFETGMTQAFASGFRSLSKDGIGCVVFAHKTTEGWEALLSGMVRSGWAITASWPLATEMGTRLRARDSAALTASVHLVCRPREEDAPVGDWAVVSHELPQRVQSWTGSTGPGKEC